MKVTLNTKRLILRPFELSDAKDMFLNWASDEEVAKYVTWNAHKSIEETENLLKFWIEEYEKPERLNFAIVLKENNELIGGIDVVGYISDVPIVGYVLSRKYWNKGYITEAFRVLIEYLFSIGYKKIKVDAVEQNIASNKVIEKCGGILQGKTSSLFKAKGKIYTINEYEITLDSFVE